MATAPSDPWADFEALRHGVKSHTVDRLKQIITGLTEECNSTLSKTGKKQDLIDRITGELDKYRYNRRPDLWNSARSVLYQVRTSGSYSAGPHHPTNQSFTNNAAHSSSFASPRATMNGHNPPGALGGSSSSIGRYDPYAPPRRAIPPSSAPSPARSSISVPIRFKPSPFYKVDQAVSQVVECPESSGTMDRRQQSLQFALTQEHINKLSQSNPKYQLRLYCTTNTFYTSSPTGFRSNTTICPIEFPPTCEVRVNNTLLQANLKGIKKKPGTAPPADITKTARMSAGSQNRIDMIYVNSQSNTGPKKFYLVVFLVEVSTVDQLVDRLRKGKFRSLEEIKVQMTASQLDDDEIVAGKQKMSLKCPLSYTRIKIPCRSDKCVHPQCFDAFSWYSVMEQTTTWLCPVCEKQLNTEDLIVDGYFDTILKVTPESVEEVEVEPDGEWHTADNKFGSTPWLEAHRLNVSKGKEAPSISRGSSGGKRSPLKSGPTESASASRSRGEVVILDSDSDNEDEGRVKKELSPSTSSSFMNGSSRNGVTPATSASNSASASSSKRTAAVIDLTLDSDSEDAPPPPPTTLPLIKRKISDVQSDRDDEAHKRPRSIDQPSKPAAMRKDLNSHYTNGGGASTSQRNDSNSPYSRTLPPLTLHVPPNHHSPPPLTPYERPITSYSPGTHPYGHSGSYNPVYARPPPNGSSSSSYPPPPGMESRRLPPPPNMPPVPYDNPYLRPSGPNGPSWP